MRNLYVTDIAVLMADGQIREHQDVYVADGVIRAITEHGSSASQGADEAANVAAGAAANLGTNIAADTTAAAPAAETAAGTAAETAAVAAAGTTAGAAVLSGCGKLLIPGLADCHMHTGQQLLKGRVLDELPMIWTRIMLPFESTLTPETMKLSAQLAALEMILSGTTAFVDARSYHMETAAEVYAQSGLRGILSASTMDEPGLPDSIAQTADEAIAQTDRLYDAFHGQGLLKVAYSLRSLISCSEDLIRKAGERARERNTLLQAHMNEYPNEVNFFLQRYKCRPLQYLDREGILGPHFISAHSILLSPDEEQILENRDVKVCHCPFSNCGKGIPDTPSLLAHHICVGLGTDGAAHGGLSLWNEMKIFRSVMNVRYGALLADPAVMPASTILTMVSQNGYRLMGMPDGGAIDVGKKADFITININQPHLFPTGSLTNTLLECVTAGDVCDSVIDGEVVMKDRQVLTLDTERILHDARIYQEGAMHS